MHTRENTHKTKITHKKEQICASWNPLKTDSINHVLRVIERLFYEIGRAHV